MERVVLRMYRSELGISNDGFKHFDTSGRLHVGYLNDTWTLNKYITIDAGIAAFTGKPDDSARIVAMLFNDDWSPRIGVTVESTWKSAQQDVLQLRPLQL